MYNLIKKNYNWVLCGLCSIIWLIRYIKVEQTLWELGGIFIFAILSAMLYRQRSNK